MVTYFNRFEIQMTKKQATSASHPGACDDDIASLLKVPSIRRQLNKIPASKIADELSEYGAWSDEELTDERANRARIIWIAAGDIHEECHA